MLILIQSDTKIEISADGTTHIGGTIPSAPNISLNAELAAPSLLGNVKSESADGSFELNRLGYATSTRTDDNHSAFRALKDADLTFVTKTSGSTFIGNVQNEGTNNTSGNISLNENGSATFAGEITVGDGDPYQGANTGIRLVAG